MSITGSPGRAAGQDRRADLRFGVRPLRRVRRPGRAARARAQRRRAVPRRVVARVRPCRSPSGKPAVSLRPARSAGRSAPRTRARRPTKPCAAPTAGSRSERSRRRRGRGYARRSGSSSSSTRRASRPPSMRHAHRHELIPLIEERTMTMTTTENIERLERVGVPCAPIAELRPGVHRRAPRGARVSSGMRRTVPPARYARSARRCACRAPSRAADAAAPMLGADTREVLREAGYTDDEIEALVAARSAAVSP